jgi:hypothetical protein
MSTAVLQIKETVHLKAAMPEWQVPATSESTPPEVVLTQMITGSLAAQAVYVAAKLGVADLLANGAKHTNELARETESDAPSLYRVLRALAAQGVFTEVSDHTFALTPTAELLRSDSRNSLRNLAIFMGEDWHWQVWGRALYSVRTGKNAWSEVHGQEVFPYFEANPEAAKIFNEAMSSLSTLAIEAVVAGYDFSGIHSLVDIAGGYGRLLTAILEANPSLHGVLYDLPHVIEGARQSVGANRAASRCEFVSGNFFSSVPVGGDAYLLKNIIHDWDDERAVKILRKIKQSMETDGRVLLVETVVTPGNEPDLAKLLDIEMLVSPGGKERTAHEYRQLFAAAGLRLTRIVPTKSPYSVIEAVQAEMLA